METPTDLARRRAARPIAADVLGNGTGGDVQAGTRAGRRWLPWLLTAVALPFVVTAGLVDRRDSGDGFASGMQPAMAVMPVILAASFAFTGGLILRERPGHGLGRLLSWFGIGFAIGVLTDNYASFHEPPRPGRWMMLASGIGSFLFVIPLVALTPLRFPTGRLPSARWRIPLAIEALGPRIGTITSLGMLPLAALAGLVDLVRRFDRSRYDAKRTVETFGQRLRDEVDLEVLRADLLAAVGETVRPRSGGLWVPVIHAGAR